MRQSVGLQQQAEGPAAIAQRGLFAEVKPQWVEVDLKRITVRSASERLGHLGWVYSCAGKSGSPILSNALSPADKKKFPGR